MTPYWRNEPMKQEVIRGCNCSRWIRCDCGAGPTKANHIVGEGATLRLCTGKGHRKFMRSVQTVCTECGTLRWWWESWTGGRELYERERVKAERQRAEGKP